MAMDMYLLWAERLAAGSQSWDRMPRRYQSTVKQILTAWVEDGTITQARYDEIMGGD